MYGSADLDCDPDPDATFLWVTDDPALNRQTRNKMLAASDLLDPLRLTIVENDFLDSKLDPGRVYFLNIQKLVRPVSLGPGITGAGDAQCQPMTRSARSVAAPSPAIEKPDVFDARIVASGAARSMSRNTRTLSSRRSGTASITRSVAAASSNDPVNVRRASAASPCSRVSLPRSTPRSRP